ncbi:unnamed protein product, partial [Brassica oleracea var. botrytis]
SLPFSLLLRFPLNSQHHFTFFSSNEFIFIFLNHKQNLIHHCLVSPLFCYCRCLL